MGTPCAALVRLLPLGMLSITCFGTKVDVDLEVTASDVRVTVRDAGPGIPAEQPANVGRFH